VPLASGPSAIHGSIPLRRGELKPEIQALRAEHREMREFVSEIIGKMLGVIALAKGGDS
jgi:hypothetical protein